MLIRSFREIRRLNLKVADGVQVMKAGSHYRARFHGQANSVFGASTEEAKQRLRSHIAKSLGIVPHPITHFEKQLMEAFR